MAPSIDNVIELSKIFNIDLADLLGRDLQFNENRKELTENEELEMLKKTLKKKGFLDENEELSEENFNTLIEFAKANKPFNILFIISPSIFQLLNKKSPQKRTTKS